jgi:hypothetical protein
MEDRTEPERAKDCVRSTWLWMCLAVDIALTLVLAGTAQCRHIARCAQWVWNGDVGQDYPVAPHTDLEELSAPEEDDGSESDDNQVGGHKYGADDHDTAEATDNIHTIEEEDTDDNQSFQNTP